MSAYNDEELIKESGWLTNNSNACLDLKNVDINSVIKLFKQYKVKFPYKYNYKSIEDVLKSFNNLKSYDEKWQTKPFKIRENINFPIKFNGMYLSMKDNYHTYQKIDWITDYFIEESRMKSMRNYKQMSPHDAWYSYDIYLSNAIKNLINKKQKMTMENLRESLYFDRTITEECGHEKSTFLKMLFIKLGITKDSKIFDACAGWGDRMIAAMSIECVYLGVDPNTNSQPGFKKMKRILLTKNKSRYNILPLAMPDAILPVNAKNFNLVFLSPPSYDSEIYSEDKGQSINMYKNKEEWVNKFLYKTIDRCWNLLDKNGYLVVQSIIISSMAPYINKLIGVKYCGVIAVEFPSRFKPMWIWQKI